MRRAWQIAGEDGAALIQRTGLDKPIGHLEHLRRLHRATGGTALRRKSGWMRCQQRGRQGNGFIIERAQGRHDGFQPDQPADHLAGNHKYAAFITHPCPPCLRFKNQ